MNLEFKRLPDRNSDGLYLFGKSKKKEIIEVKEVERPVHLIPKFGSMLGMSFQICRDSTNCKVSETRR